MQAVVGGAVLILASVAFLPVTSAQSICDDQTLCARDQDPANLCIPVHDVGYFCMCEADGYETINSLLQCQFTNTDNPSNNYCASDVAARVGGCGGILGGVCEASEDAEIPNHCTACPPGSHLAAAPNVMPGPNGEPYGECVLCKPLTFQGEENSVAGACTTCSGACAPGSEIQVGCSGTSDRQCAPCSGTTYSPDGLVCTACEGEVNARRTRCWDSALSVQSIEAATQLLTDSDSGGISIDDAIAAVAELGAESPPSTVAEIAATSLSVLESLLPTASGEDESEADLDSGDGTGGRVAPTPSPTAAPLQAGAAVQMCQALWGIMGRVIQLEEEGDADDADDADPGQGVDTQSPTAAAVGQAVKRQLAAKLLSLVGTAVQAMEGGTETELENFDAEQVAKLVSYSLTRSKCSSFEASASLNDRLGGLLQFRLGNRTGFNNTFNFQSDSVTAEGVTVDATQSGASFEAQGVQVRAEALGAIQKQIGQEKELGLMSQVYTPDFVRYCLPVTSLSGTATPASSLHRIILQSGTSSSSSSSTRRLRTSQGDDSDSADDAIDASVLEPPVVFTLQANVAELSAHATGDQGAQVSSVTCAWHNVELDCMCNAGCEVVAVDAGSGKVTCQCSHLTDFMLLFKSASSQTSQTHRFEWEFTFYTAFTALYAAVAAAACLFLQRIGIVRGRKKFWPHLLRAGLLLALASARCLTCVLHAAEYGQVVVLAFLVAVPHCTLAAATAFFTLSYATVAKTAQSMKRHDKHLLLKNKKKFIATIVLYGLAVISLMLASLSASDSATQDYLVSAAALTSALVGILLSLLLLVSSACLLRAVGRLPGSSNVKDIGKSLFRQTLPVVVLHSAACAVQAYAALLPAEECIYLQEENIAHLHVLSAVYHSVDWLLLALLAIQAYRPMSKAAASAAAARSDRSQEDSKATAKRRRVASETATTTATAGSKDSTRTGHNADATQSHRGHIKAMSVWTSATVLPSSPKEKKVSSSHGNVAMPAANRKYLPPIVIHHLGVGVENEAGGDSSEEGQEEGAQRQPHGLSPRTSTRSRQRQRGRSGGWGVEPRGGQAGQRGHGMGVGSLVEEGENLENLDQVAELAAPAPCAPLPRRSQQQQVRASIVRGSVQFGMGSSHSLPESEKETNAEAVKNRPSWR